MPKYQDLTGRKFGDLTVIGKDEERTSHSKMVYWKCKCDCGNIKSYPTGKLNFGTSVSCGCRRSKGLRKKHGMAHTRIYSIWVDMRRRCYSPSKKGYRNYGERGITVCNEWKDDFLPFYNWAIANGYNDNLTIDRIDVNGNYCPENCRWSSRKEQAANKRDTIYLDINGEKKSLMEASKEKGLNTSMVRQRYYKMLKRLGYIDIDELLSNPKRQKKSI